MSDREVPGGEHTLAYPDQVETVDALSARAGANRQAAPRELLSTLERAEGETAIKIGRYQLLELAGAGGMGMVWSAWDPELERRVALKLVRSTSESSRARMLREGQLLARFSHPNVVPIFDVGEMGDQVYLVMEWIDGETLRSFAPDSARALVDAYRQAGDGLAAAHRAGVIHRDFKPDNAIRGADGRVRVLDFGIAHERDELALRGAGTPRYMAPEQARGEAVTAAADQYAFAVSLREAFERAGGAPKWIAAIVERGTAKDPAQRFASLDELLAALGRDPARRRRQLALGLGLLGAATAAFAFGRSATATDELEPCSAGEVELAASWNPAVRARVVARLRAAGSHVDAERVARDLDTYGATWLGEQRRTCLANESGELTVAIHEGRAACLARSRAQLAATGELLATVEPADLASALRAAGSLPDPRGCADDLGTVAPPVFGTGEQVKAVVPQVERALVLATARRADALEAARRATRDARRVGYKPLLARALLVEGRAMLVHEEDASPAFAEAMRLGLQASDDATAVEAYARWMFALAIHGKVTAENWDVMVEVAERLGRAGRFARALMYNNRGVSSLVADDVPAARTWFQRASGAAGDAPDLELLSISQNLALVEPDPIASERRHRTLYERQVAMFGPSHSDVHLSREMLAFATPELARARRELEAACAGFEASQQPSELAVCAYEAAWLADEAEDVAAAVRWMQRVRHPDPRINDLARAYVAVATGAPDRAAHVARARQLLATYDRKLFFERATIVDVLVIFARAGERTAWEQALAVCELGIVGLPRRVARTRRAVAEQWATSRPVEAAKLAREALPWYRAANDAAAVARLEQIATGSTR